MAVRVEEVADGIWVAHADTPREWAELTRAGWRRQRPPSPGLREHEQGTGFWTDRPSMLASVAHLSNDGAVQEAASDLEASYAAESDYQPPCPPGMSYFPFQRAGIELMRKRRRNLLGDQMGLGKTIQVLGLMNEWRPRRTLLVVPASLRQNWYNESRRWLVWPARTFIYPNTSTRPPRGVEVLIASYGQISYAYGRRAKDASNGKRNMFEDLHAWLKAGGSFIALDEAHKIKNPGARVTKALRDLVDVSDRALLATGTPIMNRVTELYSLVHTLDKTVLGDYESFCRTYSGTFSMRTRKVKRGNMVTFETTSTAKGVRNSERLAKVVRSSVMLRRMKRDVMKELPPKIRQCIEIEDIGGHAARFTAWEDAKSGDESAIEVVNDLKRMAEEEARDDFEAKVGQMEDLESRAFGEIARARADHAEAKAPQVIDFCQQVLDNEGCVVIMCVHHVMVDALRDQWPDAAVITGKTPVNKRQGQVERFEDGDTDVFIGTIKAAGVGITLTRSSHVVLAECEWTPADNEQAEDRCHRIGQDAGCVNAYYLVADGSIDARVANAMVEKAQIAREVLDSKGD